LGCFTHIVQHGPDRIGLLGKPPAEQHWFPVLPGGRGHRQITQNRPYKKIICGEKLMAVKVAVSAIRCCDTNLVKI
jgi:hypothetical protein